MKLLLLTGIKEELNHSLKNFDFVFEKKYRVYRSVTFPNLYATTTGPGLSRKKIIRKLVKNLQPDVIVNAGLLGILENEHKASIGDRLSLSSVKCSFFDHTFVGSLGENCLVSVERPVFCPSQKRDLALDYDAQACDMESSLLLHLLCDLKEAPIELKIIFTKIVGDRPGDYLLFQNESLLWNWNNKDFFAKFFLYLRFPGGPLRLLQLKKKKERALHSLSGHLEKLIHSLIDKQGIHKKIDSVFMASMN